MQTSKRVAAAGIAGLAAAWSLAGVAVAARPIAGATYSGSFIPGNPRTTPVSFKVSTDGKRVGSFAVAIPPVACQGGAFGNPEAGSAPVSKTGRFTVKLKLYFAPRHSTNGELVVTGTFLAKGHEQGKISSIFTNKLYPKSCDKTTSYTTSG